MKKELRILGSAVMIMLLGAVLSNCSKDDQQPQPSISSFSPALGLAGSQVTISGDNFSDQASAVTVQFNGTNAVVSSSSKTTVVVTVPSGATTGKIAVAVNGKTATSANDFTVLLPATITSFSPSSGLVGASVTITGTNFDATPANNVVKFNGTLATVTAATATSLTTTVPAGATTGTIAITVNGQTATSASSFTVLLPPTVTGLAPASGATGTTVTITGTNFDTTPANNAVKFNGTVATVTAATATSLTTTVPAGATTGTITVTVNGQTATSASSFTVLLPPTVTGLAPASGLVGAAVTITGTNFDATPANNVVKFNGTMATVTAATATSLTTTVPAGATTGTVTVTVNGQTATSTSSFTVLLPPTVTSLSPASGAAGTTVVIKGTNFDVTPANNVVKFNGMVATVTAATTTSLTTTVPAGATTGTITVTVNEQMATSTSTFTVVSPCAGKPDLIISNLVVTRVFNNNELNYEFDLTNVGDVSADLTKVVTQAEGSKNAAGTMLTAAGGATIGPYLAPSSLPSGQTAHIAYSSNVIGAGTYDTYPYLLIEINTTLTECSTANNTAITSVH